MDLTSLRVGIVSYVNALPLEFYLPEFLPDAAIVKDVPSQLAVQLERGELDVALLSAAVLNRHPEYRFIPGWGIASNGPVRSVQLFSKNEPRLNQVVALDNSSLSSVLMLRILYREYWKHEPAYLSYTPPIENGLNIADAALSIGDPTLLFTQTVAYQFDIGELWRDYCRRPFVYALWITRADIDPDRIARPFNDAAEKGLANVDFLSTLPPRQPFRDTRYYREYFTDCIQYRLDAAAESGMRFFLQKAKTMNAIQ